MSETFEHRVARIAHDHNISVKEAERVARAEIKLENRKAANKLVYEAAERNLQRKADENRMMFTAAAEELKKETK